MGEVGPEDGVAGSEVARWGAAAKGQMMQGLLSQGKKWVFRLSLNSEVSLAVKAAFVSGHSSIGCYETEPPWAVPQGRLPRKQSLGGMCPE